ncbi:MAG TPA: hypothetical protein VJM31_08030 [Vicinamibacterales bacterium]|nr:hypothetical protein [Vicinamibacterales bacterium]
MSAFAFFALAFGLYWPALSLGFLSDDFGLSERAATWRVGAVTLELFRPLPLSVWALMLQLGAGAKTIHALNITLHAANAWLTTQIASEWVRDKWAALSAGLLMIAMPLAPEAVVWSAGVFDVMATTLAVTAVLIGHRYANGASYRLRASFLLVGLLALLAKETAAVVPLIVIVDGWVRKRFPRPLVLDTAILFGVVGIVAVVRLALRFGVTGPPLAIRLVRRAVFRSFGGLAFPWHADLLATSSTLPLLAALVTSALAIAFLLHAGSERLTRVAVACSGWILIGILPVFHVFFIGPDLQSSRYLYLSSVGWSVLLVTLIWDLPSNRSWSRPVKLLLMIFLVSASVLGTRAHVTPWIEAAALRDTVAREAKRVQQAESCERITVSNLPDNNRGAYVFRVNAIEALGRISGAQVQVGDEMGPCSFRWNEQRLIFLPSDR